jgi:esterase/lipase superfamily enzyme
VQKKLKTVTMERLNGSIWGLFGVALASLALSGCLAVRPGTTILAKAPLGIASGTIKGRPDLAATRLDEDIPVFLICGRNLVEAPKGVNPFGNQRNRHQTPHLAIATVMVGAGLSREEILRETLSSAPGKRKTRFELKKIDLYPELSVDHYALDHSHENFSRHPWVDALKKRMDQGQSRVITIFVHGYNTDFVPNTEFTAQMDHFGGRDGAVVSFEWPSTGLITAYAADKGNASYSTRVFRGVIANIAQETGAKKVNIVAHSAGTPIVVDALRELRLINRDLSADQLQKKFRISKVALAAADMDLMSYFNGVFDKFDDMTEGVAVYASSADQALDFSRKLYKSERLGQAVESLAPWEQAALLKNPKIEMIDVKVAENQSDDGLGHSYFYQNTWVSSDIFGFVTGASPIERNLIKESGEIFWQFPAHYLDLMSF